MISSELPREGVEIAHTLDSYQECLISGEACLDQSRHLLTQTRFQFCYVCRANRLGGGGSSAIG